MKDCGPYLGSLTQFGEQGWSPGRDDIKLRIKELGGQMVVNFCLPDWSMYYNHIYRLF